MEEKIDEISAIKAQLEKSIAEKYISKNDTILKNNFEDAMLESVKNYHKDKLNYIYDLRTKRNFTSIQSIADEINSLKLIDSIKSDNLFKKYENFLRKDKYEIRTIFENRTANVINSKGQVMIDGKTQDFKIPISKSSSGRYVYDESVRTAKVAIFSNGYNFIEYSAGREKHKDTFGRTFFRYFTEFKSYVNTRRGLVLYPAIFNIDSSSIAGFSQSGDNPFGDFAFSMQYPSGSGDSVRNTGGQKWTAYQPEGGSIKGFFTISIQNRYGGVTETQYHDFKYTR